MGVAEEDKRAVGERRGNLRRSIGHHTELGEQRLALIHVEQVFSAPSKGFSALARFEAEQINLTERLELEAMLRGEVLADHTNQPHGREPTRSGGEVRRAAAKHMLYARSRRVDGVDADGSSDEK